MCSCIQLCADRLFACYFAKKLSLLQALATSYCSRPSTTSLHVSELQLSMYFVGPRGACGVVFILLFPPSSRAPATQAARCGDLERLAAASGPPAGPSGNGSSGNGAAAEAAAGPLFSTPSGVVLPFGTLDLALGVVGATQQFQVVGAMQQGEGRRM
jgi:hypothetical protein